MFYNAMQRKGWSPREEDMRSVVAIHNAVNEQTWREVLKWERLHQAECGQPRLVRFQGRPTDYSPKARLRSLVGYQLPFDRHDWVVDRCGKQVGPCRAAPSPASAHNVLCASATFIECGKAQALRRSPRSPPPAGSRGPVVPNGPRRAGAQVRYVIDFYNGRPDPSKPVSFYLDVRPALDDWGGVVDRVRMLVSPPPPA